jgi:hypothetical protein
MATSNEAECQCVRVSVHVCVYLYKFACEEKVGGGGDGVKLCVRSLCISIYTCVTQHVKCVRDQSETAGHGATNQLHAEHHRDQ